MLDCAWCSAWHGVSHGGLCQRRDPSCLGATGGTAPIVLSSVALPGFAAHLRALRPFSGLDLVFLRLVTTRTAGLAAGREQSGMRG